MWLSVPSPGLVDHAWFQSHLEYPVLMALGSLVLLTLLLGCLAVEARRAKMWNLKSNPWLNIDVMHSNYLVVYI